MDRQELYDNIAARKIKPKDFGPYMMDNGRVNKAVALFRNGTLRTGGALLDVGGAIGDLGYAVRDLFDVRVVVDISEKLLEAAKEKGNDTICLDVDKQGLLGIGDQEMDVVTALDFIEHIIDPEKFARECFRVLSPGGQVFINTPNIQFWRYITALMSTGHFPHTSGDREVYHGGHLAFFTFLDVVEIFKSAGFTGFQQIMDEEGFQAPADWFWKFHQERFGYVRNKDEYVEQMMRFGCPNLLIKITKP